MNEIIAKMESLLQMPGTSYFIVQGADNTTIRIRVSDHSMNRQNNGDILTLSFVSSRTEQRKSGYNQSVNEWKIMDNGLTDTYQEIVEILEDHNLTGII